MRKVSFFFVFSIHLKKYFWDVHGFHQTVTICIGILRFSLRFLERDKCKVVTILGQIICIRISVFLK